MSRFVTVARTADIPPGERDIFEINGVYLAVFNIDGTFYAIEDCCTHDDGPLAEGQLHGFQIECPRHGARFDVRTGAALTMPAVTPTRRFAVRVEGDTIQVQMEEE